MGRGGARMWGTGVAGRQTRGTRCDPGEKLPMTPQAMLPQPDSSATCSATMRSTGARDDMTIPSQVVKLLEELSEARPWRGGRSGS